MGGGAGTRTYGVSPGRTMPKSSRARRSTSASLCSRALSRSQGLRVLLEHLEAPLSRGHLLALLEERAGRVHEREQHHHDDETEHEQHDDAATAAVPVLVRVGRRGGAARPWDCGPTPHPRAPRPRARPRPGTAATGPSSSSMRSSWLYFATRSLRAGAPVLIIPQLVATARSAIVASSVSPLRCDITDVSPWRRPSSTVSSVSVSVPIWLTLIRIEFATPRCDRRSATRSGLVTNRSSPTSCTRGAEPVGERLPAVPVVLAHAVLDRDDRVAVAQVREVVGELGAAEYFAPSPARS